MQASSNPTKNIVLIALCVLLSSLTGAFAGYYAALKTPASSNIAVLDIEQLATSIDPSSKDYILKAQALSDKTKLITAQLTASGIVVLDRAQVISAPDESIIHVDIQSN